MHKYLAQCCNGNTGLIIIFLMLKCDPLVLKIGLQTDLLLQEKKSMNTLFFEEVTSKTSLSVNLQKLNILCHKILPLFK